MKLNSSNKKSSRIKINKLKPVQVSPNISPLNYYPTFPNSVDFSQNSNNYNNYNNYNNLSNNNSYNFNNFSGGHSVNNQMNVNPTYSILLLNIPSINDIQYIFHSFCQNNNIHPNIIQNLIQYNFQILDTKSVRILFENEQILNEFSLYLKSVKKQNNIFKNMKIEKESSEKKEMMLNSLNNSYNSINSMNSINSINNRYKSKTISSRNLSEIKPKRNIHILNNDANTIVNKSLKRMRGNYSYSHSDINDGGETNPKYLYQKNKLKHINVSEVLNLEHDYDYNFNGLRINPFSLRPASSHPNKQNEEIINNFYKQQFYIRNGSPYITENTKKNVENFENKKKFFCHKDFFPRVGKYSEKYDIISNYVQASPGENPLLHKFRTISKNKWIDKRGFNLY